MYRHFAVLVMLLAVLTVAYRDSGQIPHRSRAPRGPGSAEGRGWVQMHRPTQLS